eukprot:15532541-Heterocapsa_arctica.AAC.1
MSIRICRGRCRFVEVDAICSRSMQICSRSMRICRGRCRFFEVDADLSRSMRIVRCRSGLFNVDAY